MPSKLTPEEAALQVRAWLTEGHFSALNVAGRREENAKASLSVSLLSWTPVSRGQGDGSR